MADVTEIFKGDYNGETILMLECDPNQVSPFMNAGQIETAFDDHISTNYSGMDRRDTTLTEVCAILLGWMGKRIILLIQSVQERTLADGTVVIVVTLSNP